MQPYSTWTRYPAHTVIFYSRINVCGNYISPLEGSDDDVSTRVATSSFFVEIIARVPSGLKATLCGPKPVSRSMTLTSFWVSITDTVSDLPDSLVKIPYL
ncbi:MAG: hypothetical protein CM1200mP30_26460 [Pseudomonadota bacterium]|nr:MAG: hypothetical protein CM1200mP30_26460 [Pseudomonadota bacterium]